MSDIETRRRHENEDVIRRLKRGESLTRFPITSSWFPPRPIIQKDPKAIAAIYGDEEPKNQKRSSLKIVEGSMNEKAEK